MVSLCSAALLRVARLVAYLLEHAAQQNAVNRSRTQSSPPSVTGSAGATPTGFESLKQQAERGVLPPPVHRFQDYGMCVCVVCVCVCVCVCFSVCCVSCYMCTCGQIIRVTSCARLRDSRLSSQASPGCGAWLRSIPITAATIHPPPPSFATQCSSWLRLCRSISQIRNDCCKPWADMRI